MLFVVLCSSLTLTRCVGHYSVSSHFLTRELILNCSSASACDADIQSHLGPECPRLPWQPGTGLFVKHRFPLLSSRTLDLAGASHTQRNVWMDPLHSHTHTACLAVWLHKRNLTSKLGQGGSCCILSPDSGRGPVQRTVTLFWFWGGRCQEQ